MPPAVAFLPKDSVSPQAVRAAEAEGRRLGVSAQAQLVASEAISEEAYYRALAQRLKLPFLDSPPPFASSARHVESVRAGVAAIAGPYGSPRWLLAPPLEGLERAMRQWRPADLRDGRLLITTPTRFETWWLQAHGASQAHAAVTELGDRWPALTAAAHGRFVGGTLALTLVGTIALLAGEIAGRAQVWLALAAIWGSVFAVASLVRLFAAAASCDPEPPEPHALSDAELPVYTVLVPLYREARVLGQLLKALAALDYPRAKLDVRLLVEADDGETRQALAKVRLPVWCRVLVAPPGAPRTKPRAMQIALPFARGSLLTIFDAEDEPAPDQLRRAAALFAVAPARVACLQARLAIDNVGDSRIAALFGIEYAALFDAINPGLATLNFPIPLGGTSNHFRIGALRRVGGWDAWNVTEDADLGLRLARFGYCIETLASTTHEEAPTNLPAWMAQRRRWLKGWMQTTLTHGRNPARLIRDMGLLRAMVALGMMLGGVMGPLLGPFFAAAVLRDALFGPLLRPSGAWQVTASTVVCFATASGVSAMVLPLVLGMSRRRLWGYAGLLPLLPAYWFLVSIAAWWALHDLLRSPFHWAKTEHGLARTSRRSQRGTLRGGPGSPALRRARSGDA